MNLASIIILLIISALVFIALKQARKNGTCSCGKCEGNCKYCSECKK